MIHCAEFGGSSQTLETLEAAATRPEGMALPALPSAWASTGSNSGQLSLPGLPSQGRAKPVGQKGLRESGEFRPVWKWLIRLPNAGSFALVCEPLTFVKAVANVLDDKAPVFPWLAGD